MGIHCRQDDNDPHLVDQSSTSFRDANIYTRGGEVFLCQVSGIKEESFFVIVNMKKNGDRQ